MGAKVKPMSTLVEEQHNREMKPLLKRDSEEVMKGHGSFLTPEFRQISEYSLDDTSINSLIGGYISLQEKFPIM